MRCQVSIENILRLARSPRTKGILPEAIRQNKDLMALLRSTEGCYAQLKARLWSEVRTLARLRTKKKFKQIACVVEGWKRDNISMRQVAQVTNTYPNYIYFLVTKPNVAASKLQNVNEKKRAVDFMKQTNITMRIPFKRHAKQYFFRTSYQQSYSKYKHKMTGHGYKALSMSTVLRSLPRKKFKPVTKVPYIQCLCSTCENFSLAILAAVYAKVKGISRSCTTNICKSLCSVSQHSSVNDIYEYHRDCIRRECTKCSAKFAESLVTQNPDLDYGKPAIWHQWVSKYELQNGTRVKIDYTKELKKGTVGELIGLIKLMLTNLPLHVFLWKWQGDQFELCKDKLREGEILMVMDFAKNVTFPRQGEVLYAFWHRKPATLHAVVCYYRCPIPKCNQLVTEEVMCISNDLDHDAHAVHAFEEEALIHVQRSGVPIQKIIQFTDNCSKQYKCYKSFSYISNCPIPMERNYFGAGHGKGPGDASVGRTKMEVDAAIRGGRADIQVPKNLAQYCKESMGTPPPAPGKCLHFRREFLYFGHIDRSFKCMYTTLPGTMKLHAVRNCSTPGTLSVRDCSCFCR